jgi:hypothetical protein
MNHPQRRTKSSRFFPRRLRFSALVGCATLCGLTALIAAQSIQPGAPALSTPSTSKTTSKLPQSPCAAVIRADESVCQNAEPVTRPQDQMWLVSSRELGYPECPDGGLSKLEVLLHVKDDDWKPAPVRDFLCCEAVPRQGERLPIVCVHIHGNRIDRQEALRRGWAVYHEVARRAPDDQPIRFVVWSWPSDRIRGQLRDVRAKAVRSDAESYYLTGLLSEVDPKMPISLIGHSLGARIISGTMHLLAGGALGEYERPDRPAADAMHEPLLEAPAFLEPIPEASDDTPEDTSEDAPEASPVRVRAVLMAAAMHDYWLMPDQYHGRAVESMDRMLVLYNSADPLLRRYRLVSKGEKPRAIGYSGIAGGDQLGPALQRIVEIDVRCHLGRAHWFMDYLCTPPLMDEAAPYILWQPIP